jgi:hypothetical protein
LLRLSPVRLGPKFSAPMNAIVEQPKAKTAYERLPRRYRRFVDEWVSGKSGVDSARRAGYKGKFPQAMAWKVSHRPEVQEAIAEREAAAVRDAGVRHVRIVSELHWIATCDPRKLVDGEGVAIPLHELPQEVAACISAVDVENISINGETGTRYKYKFWDKNKALDKLGQYLKLWEAGTKNVTNVDARSVTNVVAAGPEALSGAIRLLEQARTIAVVGAAADSDPNGSLLPAPVRDEPQGRGASVDAGEDT